MFEKYRKEILQARLLMVEGKVQIESEVIHVIVNRCFNLTTLLKGLTPIGNDDLPVLTLARSDETTKPYPEGSNKGHVQENKQREAFHKGRNFK